MTPTQAAVLDYYRERITRGGFVPTQVEAGQHFGVSTMRINTILRRLEEAGHLVRTPGKVRGVELAGAVSLVGVSSDAMRAELARRGELLDALNGSERVWLGRPRSYGAGSGTCAADGCQMEVKRGHLMCLEHRRAIPFKLQQRILTTHAAARRSRSPADAERYREAVTEARDVLGQNRASG